MLILTLSWSFRSRRSRADGKLSKGASSAPLENPRARGRKDHGMWSNHCQVLETSPETQLEGGLCGLLSSVESLVEHDAVSVAAPSSADSSPEVEPLLRLPFWASASRKTCISWYSA